MTISAFRKSALLFICAGIAAWNAATAADDPQRIDVNNPRRIDVDNLFPATGALVIWVEPNNGQGSVFYVEIPAAADPPGMTHMGQKTAARR